MNRESLSTRPKRNKPLGRDPNFVFGDLEVRAELERKFPKGGRRRGAGRRVVRRGRRISYKKAVRGVPYCIKDLVDYCNRGDVSSLRRHVSEHKGSRVPLCWPSDAVLNVGDVGTLRHFNDEDLRRCQTDYLGCYEAMTVIGQVATFAFEFPILVGERGHIYAYDCVDECLYLAAPTFSDFLENGLVRMDSLHGTDKSLPDNRALVNLQCQRSERLRYAASVADFKDMWRIVDPREMAVYVKRNRGKALRLTWPEDHFLTLTDAQAAGVSCWELRFVQDCLKPPEPVCMIGIVTASCSRTVFRDLGVFVSDSGRVYSHVLGSRHLSRLADTFRMFVRVGLYWMIDNYRYECIGGVFPNIGNEAALSNDTLPIKKRRYVRCGSCMWVPWAILR